jgi:ADP-heptose:LPS heptosyltransferase
MQPGVETCVHWGHGDAPDDVLIRSIPAMPRIAIVRALPGLGDLLCIIPACRALRRALPAAQITLISLPAAREFARRFAQYVDALLEFPSYPGIEEAPLAIQRIPEFLAQAQAQAFDLALQCHGSGTITNPFTLLLGARRTAGFFLSGQYCPEPELFLPWRAEESEIQRYLRLLRHLGIPDQGEELEFPVWAEDIRAFEQIGDVAQLRAGSYVCIHPGARAAGRRWPPACFAAVADTLAQAGWRIVLTGVACEADLTRAVIGMMRMPALDLTGRTSLGTLAVLRERSRLLICNDTGISHLADALCRPSVVIFSDSDPRRWAPLDRRLHRVVGSGGTAISLAEQTTPEVVLQEAQALLSQRSAVAVGVGER